MDLKEKLDKLAELVDYSFGRLNGCPDPTCNVCRQQKESHNEAIKLINELRVLTKQ